MSAPWHIKEKEWREKKTYGEILAGYLAHIIEDRQIDDVLHFTHLENLSTLWNMGSKPAQASLTRTSMFMLVILVA